MLAALLQVTFLLLSVEYVLSSSSEKNEVQSQEKAILSKPSTHVIGANQTTLVICRSSSKVLSLQVKCRGLRHKVPLRHLTTVDDNVPPVTTSRLIITPHVVRNHKHSLVCYCIDTSTKDKSAGLVVSMKQANHFVWTAANHFRPKRDRKRKVTLHSPVKISWRFHNSSMVQCLRDGHLLLGRETVVHTRGKSSVLINDTLRADAGFYYCKSTSGVYSSWFELQVLGSWSEWHPWLPCSTQCGPGKKVEIRRCLENRRGQCRGPSIRAVPCIVQCKGIVPEFLKQPEDQVISKGLFTYITCAAQFGSSAFSIQLSFSSNGWMINYFLNTTEVWTAFGNKTIRSKTYKLALHRGNNQGLAVVNCHCDALTNEMSRRSRVAKITFTSGVDDGTGEKWISTIDQSIRSTLIPSSVTNKTTRVEAEQTEVTTALSTLSVILLMLVSVLGFVVCIVTVAIYKRRIRKLRRDQEGNSVATKETSIDRTSCETERLRYSEAPDRTPTKLHSGFSSGDDLYQQRDSNSPLLTCHLEEHDSLPAKYCVSHPSNDISTFTEDTPCDDESVFKRDESWKSNKSKFSSVSAAFCPKPEIPDTVDPDLCAWGQFTEKGGRLTIQGTGVRLDIPPMALPKETSQVIYIGLMNSKGTYPKLSGKEALLSPVVVCGPDGLKFEKPVYLTVPHNAVMDENNSWNPQVQSCNTMDEENEKREWKVIGNPDGNAPLTHVNDKYMQIMIQHFTNFAIVGVASCSGEASPQLKTWIVAYFTEPKIDLDCTVRVYCIPATDAAYKVLEGIESKVNGKTSDTHKLLIINNNGKCLQVKSKLLKEGWSAVTGEEKSIPFVFIWQCIKESPNVSFIFERKSPNVFTFRSIFDVKQEQSANCVEVQAMFAIQNDRRASSGYSSQANGWELEVAYKIPNEIRHEICFVLDREDPLGLKDWRNFAEKLKCSANYIAWLKDNNKVKSPTYEIIEWWERTMSEKIHLQCLVEILKEMERCDLEDVIKKLSSVADPAIA